jgi:hypothetical protein
MGPIDAVHIGTLLLAADSTLKLCEKAGIVGYAASYTELADQLPFDKPLVGRPATPN